MYRHSLFFDDPADADTAESRIDRLIYMVILDSFQDHDEDSGTHEVRFFTKEKLSDLDQRVLLWGIPAVASYALNCDDGA